MAAAAVLMSQDWRGVEINGAGAAQDVDVDVDVDVDGDGDGDGHGHDAASPEDALSYRYSEEGSPAAFDDDDGDDGDNGDNGAPSSAAQFFARLEEDAREVNRCVSGVRVVVSPEDSDGRLAFTVAVNATRFRLGGAVVAACGIAQPGKQIAVRVRCGAPDAVGPAAPVLIACSVVDADADVGTSQVQGARPFCLQRALTARLRTHVFEDSTRWNSGVRQREALASVPDAAVARVQEIALCTRASARTVLRRCDCDVERAVMELARAPERPGRPVFPRLPCPGGLGDVDLATALAIEAELAPDATEAFWGQYAATGAAEGTVHGVTRLWLPGVPDVFGARRVGKRARDEQPFRGALGGRVIEAGASATPWEQQIVRWNPLLRIAHEVEALLRSCGEACVVCNAPTDGEFAGALACCDADLCRHFFSEYVQPGSPPPRAVRRPVPVARELAAAAPRADTFDLRRALLPSKETVAVALSPAHAAARASARRLVARVESSRTEVDTTSGDRQCTVSCALDAASREWFHEAFVDRSSAEVPVTTTTTQQVQVPVQVPVLCVADGGIPCDGRDQTCVACGAAPRRVGVVGPWTCGAPTCVQYFTDHVQGAGVALRLLNAQPACDLLLALFGTAVALGDLATTRADFPGFPPFVRQDTTRDVELVASAMSAMPATALLARAARLGDADLAAQLRAAKPEQPCLFPLLRWVLSSHGQQVRALGAAERLPGFPDTVAQYAVTTKARRAECTFAALRRAHGVFHAWHGVHGRYWGHLVSDVISAHGSGIHLAADVWTALRFGAGPLICAEGSVSDGVCVVLCDVAGSTPPPEGTVHVEQHAGSVMPRVLLVLPPGFDPRTCDQQAITAAASAGARQ